MSSWHQQHATGVYGDCCVGDCSPGDLCYYNWDRRGCPHNPVFNRFVTVGSIKYGVRVGAVSPPPPGVRYRTGASGAGAGIGLLPLSNYFSNTTHHNHHHHQQHQHHLRQHHRYEPTATAATDKDCCCSVVNLPWPRSVASVSRIPLLADKHEVSINSCGIFSSVNSADMSNGYASCSSLLSTEYECEPEHERENERERTFDSKCPSPASPTTTTATASTLYRSRPSWSHPPQFGLRGCIAATEQLRSSSSSSTATQLFLQSHSRRRVLVRSRSDTDADGLVTTTATATAHNSIELTTDPVAARRDTLDRLHRFRFGGNRGNIRGKKTCSEDKTERLRELTDRFKNATQQSSPLQKHASHQNEDMVTTRTDNRYGPVPPPRTRHQQSLGCARTPTSTSTSTTTVMQSPPPSLSPSPPVLPTSPMQLTPPSPPTSPPPQSPLVVSSSLAAPSSPSPPTSPSPEYGNTNELTVQLNLPKPEARSVVGSYMQRTIPFRSASFSLVDFSSDGKYFRKCNTTDSVGENCNRRTASTLPRNKKEHQTRHLNSTASPASLSVTTFLSSPSCSEPCRTSTITQPLHVPEKKSKDSDIDSLLTADAQVDKLFAMITQEACGIQNRNDMDDVDANVAATLNQSDVAKQSNIEEKKRDRSRRRKGMYISQWPDQRASVMLAYAQNDQSAVTDSGEACVNIFTNSVDEPLHLQTLLPDPGTEDKPNCFSRVDSFSEGENEHTERRPVTPNRDQLTSPVLSPSDVSDTESRTNPGNELSLNVPRRYSKRPLRGPYGQMLEAEMKRPEISKTFSKHNYNNELKFLDDLPNNPTMYPSSNSNIAASMTSLNSGNSVNLSEVKPKIVNRSRGGSNHSLDDSSRKISGDVSCSASTSIPGFGDMSSDQRRLFACHQRTTSSPSKLEEITLPNQSDRAASAEPSADFLCDFLQGSSERLTIGPVADSGSGIVPDDTRTHIVVELYETERSYVDSLQILVLKYLEPLKSAENSFLLDAALVDEIFYQVPALLSYHQDFLEELRKRLEHWDMKQKIGDVFLELTKPTVVETYTSFINNWKRAKEVIKITSQAKPAFARFLEAMAREHKGKLALDSLLIKPVQKFPKYELLIQRLIKHTDTSHPDYPLLLEAQREIHDNLIKINCTERETVEFEQQQQNLKELESLVEGLVNLVTADRVYLRHDLVTMTSGQGTRKERALFLFSDLLVITSIKRKSGTIKKPTSNCPGSVTSTLDANKYKLLMRIPLDDLEIVKVKDENVRRVMLEIENLTEDISLLNQINELVYSLHCPRAQLEDVVREMLCSLNRQLADQQNIDSQLSYLDLTLNTPNGVEHLSIVFSQPEKRANWEESFNEAKQKLAISVDRRPSPEFLMPVPIRKTRAGLQFTCAAPTLTSNNAITRDVWVCNSDGYVGQVCVLSLHPEPTVTSCNGVCSARILCVASVPAGTASGVRKINSNAIVEDEENRSTNIQLDSSSSSADEEDSEKEEYVESRCRNSSPLNRGKSTETASTDSSDDTDSQQPTMWLGTEDGCIHVYNCNDNIRIKKNKIRLQHGSSILCVIYLDNRVFVSMANGDISIYSRDQSGSWNTSSPLTVSVSTAMMPVNKMLPNSGKLWCSCNNSIKILNIHSLTVEHTFQTNGDQNKAITGMVMSGLGVWLSLHNSAVIKCFHSLTYDFLCEVNMAPAVTKMLTSCDDIIRQHKAACLRVTSLLACKDLLWVGTSAGVLLTMPLPHITTSTTKISIIPTITGVPHGHTGHVRFLTCMETGNGGSGNSAGNNGEGNTISGGIDCCTSSNNVSVEQYNSKLLVISGGDGYEDFRSSNMSDVAGREDSTNHLLLWHV